MTVVGYGSVLRRILSVMYRGQLRGQVKNRLMVLMIFPEPTALASTDAESSAISSKAVRRHIYGCTVTVTVPSANGCGQYNGRKNTAAFCRIWLYTVTYF